jgi:hypothetical protein
LSPGGAASTEDIFLLERNPRFSKQAHEFLFKVSFLVMLSLIADVALNIGDARGAHHSDRRSDEGDVFKSVAIICFRPFGAHVFFGAFPSAYALG